MEVIKVFNERSGHKIEKKVNEFLFSGSVKKVLSISITESDDYDYTLVVLYEPSQKELEKNFFS